MRELHPGFHAFLELHVEDVEAFLAENYEPIASEEVPILIGVRPHGDLPASPIASINLAHLIPAGSA